MQCMVFGQWDFPLKYQANKHALLATSSHPVDPFTSSANSSTGHKWSNVLYIPAVKSCSDLYHNFTKETVVLNALLPLLSHLIECNGEMDKQLCDGLLCGLPTEIAVDLM